MYTITPTQAKEIIDIACRTWKQDLAEKWGAKITLNEDIEVTEEEVQEMREEAIVHKGIDQRPVIERIFQQEFKVGDLVYSDCPNIDKKAFEKAGGLVGKLLEIEGLSYLVEADGEKYPFLSIGKNNAKIWCYGGITRKATEEEIKAYNNTYKKGEIYLALDEGNSKVMPLRYNGDTFINKHGTKWEEKEWDYIKPNTPETIKEFFLDKKKTL